MNPTPVWSFAGGETKAWRLSDLFDVCHITGQRKNWEPRYGVPTSHPPGATPFLCALLVGVQQKRDVFRFELKKGAGSKVPYILARSLPLLEGSSHTAAERQWGAAGRAGSACSPGFVTKRLCDGSSRFPAWVLSFFSRGRGAIRPTLRNEQGAFSARAKHRALHVAGVAVHVQRTNE